MSVESTMWGRGRRPWRFGYTAEWGGESAHVPDSTHDTSAAFFAAESLGVWESWKANICSLFAFPASFLYHERKLPLFLVVLQLSSTLFAHLISSALVNNQTACDFLFHDPEPQDERRNYTRRRTIFQSRQLQCTPSLQRSTKSTCTRRVSGG